MLSYTPVSQLYSHTLYWGTWQNLVGKSTSNLGYPVHVPSLWSFSVVNIHTNKTNEKHHQTPFPGYLIYLLTVFPAPFGPTISVSGLWNSITVGSVWE